MAKEALAIALRTSVVRERLNELSGISDLTEEHRAEIEVLSAEYKDLEIRGRAAAIAREGEIMTPGTPDPDKAELIESASLSDVVGAAVEQRSTEGATRELQDELGLASNTIPLDLLEVRTTGVTPAPSDVGSTQAPIIPAIFPMSVAAYLGIPQPRVGVGERTYTVLSTSATPGTPAKGADQDHSTGAFTASVLDPKRIQASMFFAVEDRARLAGLSEALRMNLNEALMDKLDEVVVDDLLTGTTLTQDAATAADTFGTYRSRYGYDHVDGRRAGTVGDLRIAVGSPTYSSMSTKFRGASSDQDVLQALMAETGGVRVTAHAPTVASSKQDGVVRIGSRMDAVTPIWEGVRLIVDEVTQAKAGEIVLTAVMLYAHEVLRVGGFARVEAQHA